MADRLLTPSQSLFDYGCGKGDDLRNLQALGYDVEGWDPSHRPHVERQEADVVNLGYVVNVIEDADEREAVLRNAWRLTRQALVVSARMSWDSRDLVGQPHADGLVTRTGTFQKFFDQSELASWIERTTGVQPLAAAPGIFYVFRDPVAAQAFLATRVYTYRPRVTIDPHVVYETHQAILAPLVDFMTAHARPPRSGELATEADDGVRETFGSVARALKLVRRVTADAHWDQVAIQRRGELLVYIAMSRFGRRPGFTQLPMTLAYDIRALFGTYQAACTQADRLLLATGDPALILVSARSSRIGKQTPSALYVHRSALNRLLPVLQVYEGCARVLTGAVTDANIVKLSVTEPQVS